MKVRLTLQIIFVLLVPSVGWVAGGTCGCPESKPINFSSNRLSVKINLLENSTCKKNATQSVCGNNEAKYCLMLNENGKPDEPRQFVLEKFPCIWTPNEPEIKPTASPSPSPSSAPSPSPSPSPTPLPKKCKGPNRGLDYGCPTQVLHWDLCNRYMGYNPQTGKIEPCS